MRARILLIAAFLVGGFVLLTSKTEWGQRRLLQPVKGVGHIWTGPASVKSAGLAPDELNNIDIYKSAHVAVVNITTTVYQASSVFRLANSSSNCGTTAVSRKPSESTTRPTMITG